MALSILGWMFKQRSQQRLWIPPASWLWSPSSKRKQQLSRSLSTDFAEACTWLLKKGLVVPIRDAIRNAPPPQGVRNALFSGGNAHHVCSVAGTPRHLLTQAALERALLHLLKKPARKIAPKYDLDVQRVPLLISGAVS